MKKPRIYTVEGDITQLPSDALMTGINSGRIWDGGIDRAIQRVAGDMYHSQALRAPHLRDLQTVVAKKTGDHSGKFQDVVFVVDDLQSPLDKVVYAGLEAASDEGYKSLSVPSLRMGVMAGFVESPQQAIRRMADGLSRFVADHGAKTNLEDIRVVVYNNPSLAKSISPLLERI